MGADTNSYYNTVDKMLEYHINTLPIFQDILDAIGSKGKYGGWIIVRINKGKLPVICMVQDEYILKIYIFPKKVWKYNGEHHHIPKDKEYGVMIYIFKSGEFGYSYPPMTSEQLNTVNENKKQIGGCIHELLS